MPRRAELCPSGQVVPRRAEVCPVGPSCAHRAELCWRPSGRANATVVRVYEMMRLCVDDEDACHDRVAGGADHDGADHEGADARLVGADLASGRLVEGSCDVLRCVCCGIALRSWFGSARRAGGVGWSACGWRRGKREGGWRIVARTVTS